MAAEIPGFYYDEEKNRYFPVKGPIPGSKSIRKASCASSSAKPTPPASATTGADVIPGGLHISPVLFAFVSALALTNRGFFFFFAVLFLRQLYFNTCAGQGVGRKYFTFQDGQETEMRFRGWNPKQPGFPTSGNSEERQLLTAAVTLFVTL